MQQKFINPLTATSFQECNKLAYCILLHRQECFTGKYIARKINNNNNNNTFI